MTLYWRESRPHTQESGCQSVNGNIDTDDLVVKKSSRRRTIIWVNLKSSSGISPTQSAGFGLVRVVNPNTNPGGMILSLELWFFRSGENFQMSRSALLLFLLRHFLQKKKKPATIHFPFCPIKDKHFLCGWIRSENKAKACLGRDCLLLISSSRGLAYTSLPGYMCW